MAFGYDRIAYCPLLRHLRELLSALECHAVEPSRSRDPRLRQCPVSPLESRSDGLHHRPTRMSSSICSSGLQPAAPRQSSWHPPATDSFSSGVPRLECRIHVPLPGGGNSQRQDGHMRSTPSPPGSCRKRSIRRRMNTARLPAASEECAGHKRAPVVDVAFDDSVMTPTGYGLDL